MSRPPRRVAASRPAAVTTCAYRSQGGPGPEPEHFPRIDEVWDSFGNRSGGVKKPTAPPMINTQLILRPGDQDTFEGRGWDPDGVTLTWKLGLNRGPTFYVGEGDSFTATWDVEEADIAEAALVSIRLSGERAYHRLANGDDDRVVFQYSVLPRPA